MTIDKDKIRAACNKVIDVSSADIRVRNHNQEDFEWLITPHTVITLLDALDKAETDALELEIFCNRLNDRLNELVVENVSLKNEAAAWKESSKTWADQHDELAESFQCHPNRPVIERLKAELESSRAERVKDSLDATRYHTLIHNMGLVEAHATKWRPAIHKPLIQYLQDYIDDIGMALNHEGE